MNLLQPADTLVRPPYDRHARYNVNMIVETGWQSKNFDDCGPVSSPLHIWQTQQNGLAMLKGFPEGDPANTLSNRLHANDDGVRGHFKVCGDLNIPFAGSLGARFFFSPNWFVSVHLPMYHMRLRNVSFIDQTGDAVDADYRVKTLLTNDFATHVRRLGGMRLGDWARTGIGDVSSTLNWYRDFPQAKELLKNARINWRVGLTLPTGKPTDLDLLFAPGFGYGGVGLPVGLGLDLMFGGCIQTGLDLQLIHIFGRSEEVRVKTDINQTELLLLQKTCAYRDFGLIQRFNLYIGADKCVKGLSCLVGYQFLKHGADHLALSSNVLSQTIANTAESLKERTAHHIVVNVSYDFAVHTWNKKHAHPYFSVFTRIPFNGKRFASNIFVGWVLSVDF